MIQATGRASIVAAIVQKDLREFSRDRLWMILLPMSLAFLIAAFWAMPSAIDDTITVGLYPPELRDMVAALSPSEDNESQPFQVAVFEDEERLIAAVAGERDDPSAPNVAVGIALPRDFTAAVEAGRPAAVSLYVGAAVPEELKAAMSGAIREIGYALEATARGRPLTEALPVSIPRRLLFGGGTGARLPLRDQLRPMLAMIILMMEALALAGLVAVEIEHRTATAILVTPARIADFLAAKAATGAILGITQALAFLLLTNSFGHQWLVVALLVVLGAVMMSAVGMIAGAAGKDFMSTLFSALLFLLPLMVPAFATLFPGRPSLWVQLLPSHGLVQGLVGAIGHGRGLADLLPYLGATLLWAVALFGVAVWVLKRRVEAL